MKNFIINRQVQKEVVRVEYVSEPVEVHFDEITHQDLMSMKFDQVRSYASHLRMTMKNMTNEIGTVTDQLRNDMDAIIVNHDPVMSSIVLQKPDGDDGDKFPSAQIGKKMGKTSKYHYVYKNHRGKYLASIASKGVSDHMGTFENGEDAATAVDAFLDKENDFNRPRNRNEFPEIQELYLTQTNNLKEAS